MINNIALCLIFTLSGAFGGYYFKKASNEKGSIIKILGNKYLYLGGILYVIGASLNIVLLKHLNYTVVLPLTSITYVWTMVISYFILGEKITFKKILGVILIVIGAIFLVI